MKLKDVILDEHELDVFLMLTPADKINFVGDLYEHGPKGLYKYLAKVSQGHDEEEYIVRTQDIQYGDYQLYITQLGDELRINSNSLRAIRVFVSKLWFDGYMLSKLPNVKTDWDQLKYLKVYRVISCYTPLCEN